MKQHLIHLALIFFGALGIACVPAHAADKEISVEEFLQGLSTIPGAVFRKDPFVEAPTPFEVPKEDSADASAMFPVMERYPLYEYEVVATLVGDQYPRALIRLPEKEQRRVVIVKVKEHLGNRKGVISKITREGVTVRQGVRSKFGFVDNTDIVLRIGMTADKQKLEQMNAVFQVSKDGANGHPAPKVIPSGSMPNGGSPSQMSGSSPGAPPAPAVPPLQVAPGGVKK